MARLPAGATVRRRSERRPGCGGVIDIALQPPDQVSERQFPKRAQAMRQGRKPSWSLSRKGLIFIGAVLFVQLIFFGWLALLLQEQEFIAEKEYHSKQLFGHVNWLSTLVSGSILGALAYRINHDTDHLRLTNFCQSCVPQEIDSLRTTLVQNSLQKKQLDAIDNTWHQLREAINTPSFAGNIGGDEAKIKELVEQLLEARRQLNYEERTRFDPDKESPMDSRLKQKQALAMAVAISILIAVVTFQQFTKGIAGRIAFLSENSMRLAVGQPLLPVIPGSDEIANLDQSFHDMADALNAARSQLEASQKRLLTLIDNMPVGLLVVDQSELVEFANSAARTLLGVDPAGSNLSSLLSVKHSGAESAVQIEYTSGTGDISFIEISRHEITMNEGKRSLVVLLDVTERHKLEILKQEFVSMVSHDLRSPLSSIGLFLTLLQRLPQDALPAAIQSSLDIADRNTKRLLTLVNDLLDIEKLHAGRFTMSFLPVDSLSIIDEAIDSMRHVAQSKSVSLIAAGDNFEIVADGDRIVQVLVNLVSNAIKFSPANSEVHVHVRLENESALFQVTDSGRGVPPEHRSLIFEKYKQVANADGMRGKGTGLGLPICKAIVEEHRGSIGVTSGEDGAGSVFWFRIPVTAQGEGA